MWCWIWQLHCTMVQNWCGVLAVILHSPEWNFNKDTLEQRAVGFFLIPCASFFTPSTPQNSSDWTVVITGALATCYAPIQCLWSIQVVWQVLCKLHLLLNLQKASSLEKNVPNNLLPNCEELLIMMCLSTESVFSMLLLRSWICQNRYFAFSCCKCITLL